MQKNKLKEIRNDAFESSGDKTGETILQLVTSALKVGIFFGCLYILKEIFMLANDMFLYVEGQTLEVIHMEIMPTIVLLLLAVFALYLIKKN